MRESLTVLAMLLIVVLTTALVGPYFVDWDAHRSAIEKRLSGLLGADVVVTGPIDVKLLPRPIFRLADVAVHGRAPGQGTAAAQRVDMELSLTALLRGDVQFVDADITAPTVTLPLGPDRSIMLPKLGEATADRISLVHVALRDGTLVFSGADGKPQVTVGGIAGEGEAESLAGPFKFAGQVDTPRGPLALHVATGAIEGGRMRLKLGVDAADGVPKTDLDGIVAAAAAGAAGSTLGFDGTLAASGARTLANTAHVVPWRFTTMLHAEPGHIDVQQGELRAGADGRALIAAVDGDVDLGAAPAARLTLHARQADLGRLAVVPDQPSPDAADSGSAAIADDLGALGAIAGDGDLTAALPLPVALDYRIDTIVAGDLTLGGLGGQITLARGEPVAGTLAIEAADGSRLAFEGSAEPGTAAVFKGRVSAASVHLQRLAETLAPQFPAVAAALKGALPVDDFALAGTVDLSAIGVAAHDVALTLDRSRFAGTITLTRAVGQDRARLFADLTSDALDLDALPNWRDTARAAADLDVALTLVARATRLASTDTGGVDAGRVALDLKKEGRLITVNRLSLADIGGATGEFTARSDGAIAHAEGRLDAKHLRDLFTLLDRLAPGIATDQLLTRADALSPALATIRADAAVAPDGTLTPTLLSVEGTAAATTVALHLRPDAAPHPAAGAPALALDLVLDAPDTGTLLRQAGLPTAAANAIGRGRIDLSVQRDAQGVLAGTLKAALGDTAVTAEGRGDAARSTTKLTVRSPNIAPLARALLVANPQPGSVWPADAAATLNANDRRLAADNLAGRLLGASFGGTLAAVLPPPGAPPADSAAPPVVSGSLTIDRLPLPVLTAPVLGPLPQAKPGALWPDAPFDPALLSLPRSEIALTMPSFPLTGGIIARDAKATLRLGAGALTLADLSAGLGAGRIGGTLTLRRDGAAASLAGHVAWNGLPVAGPSFGGVSHGALDLAGTGNSVAALMGSLAGSGSIGIADARLPRFDPGAMGRVIAGSDVAAATLDDGVIAGQLGQELDHGALALGTVTVPVTVAAGVLRADPVTVATPVVDSTATGTLDLRSLTLSLKATASLHTPPKDWTGAPPQVSVVWKGPMLAPARDVDAAALVNGIAARAIARDQARIEAFQEDVRERAFFARRLRAIEAEQQAARDKAKADAEAEHQRQQALTPGGTAAVPAPTPDAARPGTAPATAGTPPMPPRRPGPSGKPMELH